MLSLGPDDNADRLAKLISDIFDAPANISEKRTCVTISFYGKGIAEFLHYHCGKRAENKKIPSFIMTGNKKVVLGFLKGYFKGDGCVGKSRGELIATTVSKTLAYQLVVLLAKIGLKASLCSYDESKTRIRGKEIQRKPFYRLTIRGAKATEILPFEPTPKGNVFRNLSDENFLYIPIQSLNYERGKSKVYNIETEDKSYCVPFAVHNCIWHTLEEPEGFRTELRMKFPSVANARNTGVVLADGELLVYLDDNIILQEDCLKTAWKWYKRGCGLKIIRHRYNLDGNRITLDPEFRGDRYGELWSRGQQEHTYRCAWSNAVAIPLEMELEVNGWNEDFDGVVGCDDIEHAIRLDNLAKKLGAKMMLDTSAVAWELGHRHIQHGRYNVRANFVLLDAMKERWGPDLGGRIRANDDRSYLPELMRRYAELHIQRKERDHLEYPMHPFFDYNTRVPTFDLKDLREKYRSGEFRW